MIRCSEDLRQQNHTSTRIELLSVIFYTSSSVVVLGRQLSEAGASEYESTVTPFGIAGFDAFLLSRDASNSFCQSQIVSARQ